MPFTDNGSIIRLRRKRRWQVADGIFKSCSYAVILWKSIMPVGGRVAGKGVGVYNSGGSSDGEPDDARKTKFQYARQILTIRYFH